MVNRESCYLDITITGGYMVTMCGLVSLILILPTCWLIIYACNPTKQDTDTKKGFKKKGIFFFMSIKHFT